MELQQTLLQNVVRCMTVEDCYTSRDGNLEVLAAMITGIDVDPGKSLED